VNLDRRLREYYDALVDRQVAVGTNERHVAIARWLREFGLESHHRVLEIGCGVGTVTELVAPQIPRGKLLAFDISPRSVDVAAARLRRYGHVEVRCGDYLEAELGEEFDLILLPDVLEHIPPARHGALFERIDKNLQLQGFVVVHIPDPTYQDFLRATCPERLQPVDVAVHTDELCRAVYPAGFYVHFLATYPVWSPEGEYQVVQLRKRAARTTFSQSAPEHPGLAAVRSTWSRASRLLGRF
jgi:trans-aconitate 2-methyltransferase